MQMTLTWQSAAQGALTAPCADSRHAVGLQVLWRGSSLGRPSPAYHLPAQGLAPFSEERLSPSHLYQQVCSTALCLTWLIKLKLAQACLTTIMSGQNLALPGACGHEAQRIRLAAAASEHARQGPVTSAGHLQHHLQIASTLSGSRSLIKRASVLQPLMAACGCRHARMGLPHAVQDAIAECPPHWVLPSCRSSRERARHSPQGAPEHACS